MNWNDVQNLLPAHYIERSTATVNGVLFREPDSSNLETGMRAGVQNGWNPEGELIIVGRTSIQEQLVFGPASVTWDTWNYYLADRGFDPVAARVEFTVGITIGSTLTGVGWPMWSST